MIPVVQNNRYKVIRIEPQHVDMVLPQVKPILAKSIPRLRGFETIDQMVARMKSGRRDFQLFVIIEGSRFAGAFFASFEICGPVRYLNYEVLAGEDARQWIDPLINDFETYCARMYGVTRFRVMGHSPVWARWLRSKGYELTMWVAERDAPPVSKPRPVVQTDRLDHVEGV